MSRRSLTLMRVGLESMAHDLVRAPSHSRERSLGHLANAWMEFFCRHGPGDVQGDPVVHTDEYYAFTVDVYAVDEAGRRLYDSAFLSRPKGTDKSGLGARFSLHEALGPCRFDGFAKGGETYVDPWGLGFSYRYEPGEPMGRPVRVPFIRIMATEEGQTGNVYDTIHFNLTDSDCPLSTLFAGRDAGETRIKLPGGGEITPSTAGSASKDGGKETFVVFDETHLYNTPELRRMYKTVTRNLRKRKKLAGTWFLETTTMFARGEDSVAEQTYRYAEALSDPDRRVKNQRLLFDHRYSECEDLSDDMKLRAAIAEAFGDALAWNDLDALVDEFHDLRSDTSDNRRYFLNSAQDTHDAFIRQFEWAAIKAEKVVKRGEVVTLGFDGSRGRAKDKPDATALVAFSVSQRHLFEIAVWEAPDDPKRWPDWSPPMASIEAAVDECFRDFTVAAFYCDPAKDWRSTVNAWEAKYGSKVKVHVKKDHPFEWWFTGGRTIINEQAILDFEGAILNGDITQDGSLRLTQHVLNTRRRVRASKLTLGKESDWSPNKIDACVAGVLAHRGYLDAVAAGATEPVEEFYRPKRIG